MTWQESVDEALCFGWIDGVRRGIDADSYSIRFTPRKTRSTWSAVNIKRVGELIAEGRMTPAGLAAFEARTDDRSAIYSYEQRRAAELDAEQRARFEADADAWAWFQAAGAVVPADRDPLGHEREEAGDARAPARRADRRQRGRAEDQAAAVIRSRLSCAMARHDHHSRAVLDIPALGVRVELRRTAADTDGELIEFDVVGRARGLIAAEHVHTGQTEHYEVIEGTMRLVVDGRRAPARARRRDGDAGRRAAPPAARATTARAACG